MKIRFLGPQDVITIRGVTFDKNKATEVADEYTVQKCLALDYFEEVKSGRRKKAVTNGENES